MTPLDVHRALAREDDLGGVGLQVERTADELFYAITVWFTVGHGHLASVEVETEYVRGAWSYHNRETDKVGGGVVDTWPEAVTAARNFVKAIGDY